MKPKNKDHMNFYECFDLTKKVYLKYTVWYSTSSNYLPILSSWGSDWLLITSMAHLAATTCWMASILIVPHPSDPPRSSWWRLTKTPKVKNNYNIKSVKREIKKKMNILCIKNGLRLSMITPQIWASIKSILHHEACHINLLYTWDYLSIKRQPRFTTKL